MSKKSTSIFHSIFIGNRYPQLEHDKQISYITITGFFALLITPLILIGSTYIGVFPHRLIIKSFMVMCCIGSMLLIRTTKIPHKIIPIFPVSVCGVYWLYLLYTGELGLWTSVWVLAFPAIALLLCGITIGLIQSGIVLAVVLLFFFTPFAPISPDFEISMRYVLFYLFIFGVVIIDERIRAFSERKLRSLNAALATERDIIKTMEDNIPQGIFRMNKELKILPLYSQPLVLILSYYDSDLEGKNFLDILNTSLSAPQLQSLKNYFSMIFAKSKSAKTLQAANALSEFEYKIGDRVKTLSAKFELVEQPGAEPVIIGIIQDITREKEFEKELIAQKEAQEQEMKNMFEVIQVDPMVFRDFIEDTEAAFNYINSILKDKTLTERQVVTKFFENVHSIKANALILGLETFGNRLHALEDEIKVAAAKKDVTVQDTLSLAVKLELLMQNKDSYLSMVKKVEAFKSSHQVDAVFVHSLSKAVEKLATETKKKVELSAEQVDRDILESELRKPIKDVLFQCVRNSIYHGIETPEERARKRKKPRGLLTVSLKKVDNTAVLSFSDDGRGFDWEKIRQKYREANPDAKDASNATLLSAVFTPGFSTAESTTTVAGRGFGLSLVKTLVKENGGTIKVASTESGLAFTFTFPLPA